MPVKTKTYARPNMKKATSNAPHICRNVLEYTSLRVRRLGRRMARITSQDASVDVPPPNGLKLNIDEMGLCVTDDLAATDSLNRLNAGRADHGPVQATTTRMSTMYGTQAKKAARTDVISMVFAAAAGADSSGAPPNPRVVFGGHIFTKRKQNP